MKNRNSLILQVVGCGLLAVTAPAQSINVTSTGVGIGTATPVQKLDVVGNIAASGNVVASGNLTIVGNAVIGIGASPAPAKFDITATGGAVPLLSLRSFLSGAGQYQMIRFGDYSQTTNYQKGALIYESTTSVSRGRFHIALENTDGPGSVALSDAKLTVLSNGYVGIGTVNPTYILTVNGTVKSRGYITDTSAWSDYVFAKDYKLPTLSEVEQHIAANGHLPGIPSEKEVLANGVNLGEMDSKLLAQIEQLTLHMIALNKKLESQQAEIQALRAATESAISPGDSSK
jgi:hypothetical protein